MNRHFRKELLPPVRTFYEREIGKLSRERRGYAQGNCPFHVSKSQKSFSVNMVTGAWRCFGCSAHGGSIVDFVMFRDHIGFKAACQALGAWDSAPPPEVVRKMRIEAQARERWRALERARLDAERQRRLQLRDEVHTAARLQREASDRLRELRQGAIPASEVEEEVCWDLMVLALDDLRDCEAEYCRAVGLEYGG